VRLDFVVLGPMDESNPGRGPARASRSTSVPLNISIPREVATHREEPDGASATASKTEIKKVSACLPISYVPDAKQRIELYRKFAELMDENGVSLLKAELRDRFGPLPKAVELLLVISTLKLLAARHDIGLIESREDKLMLTRHNDFIMVEGKFPRLTRREPRARLDEIKRLLLTI
jgi:transcription-repair coupling factor (superfamily II helicase)